MGRKFDPNIDFLRCFCKEKISRDQNLQHHWIVLSHVTLVHVPSSYGFDCFSIIAPQQRTKDFDIPQKIVRYEIKPKKISSKVQKELMSSSALRCGLVWFYLINFIVWWFILYDFIPSQH